MKIKGDEYCRLHAIITEVSSRDVWKYLKEGLPLTELLENVPDEFDAWVKEQVRSLQNLYQLIDSTAKNKYYSEIDPQEGETRKDVALRILKYDKNLHPIFFHLYDGKDYAHIIWNKIYPKYSKPFTINDEEGDEN
jgi:RNA ligase